MIKLAQQTLLRISIMVAVASCLLVGDGLRSGTHSASAQEVQVTGPLADAPAVMRLRLWRENRLQLEPFFAFTFGDDYSRSLIFGGEARYSFLDWLGIGIWGGGSFVHLNTDLTRQVRDKGVTTNRNRLSLPSRENFPDQIGRLDWLAGVDVHFTPFRGKLAMFQKGFVDADLDFFIGPCVPRDHRAIGHHDRTWPTPVLQPAGRRRRLSREPAGALQAVRGRALVRRRLPGLLQGVHGRRDSMASVSRSSGTPAAPTKPARTGDFPDGSGSTARPPEAVQPDDEHRLHLRGAPEDQDDRLALTLERWH